jgi:hypothetical protein
MCARTLYLGLRKWLSRKTVSFGVIPGCRSGSGGSLLAGPRKGPVLSEESVPRSCQALTIKSSKFKSRAKEAFFGCRSGHDDLVGPYYAVGKLVHSTQAFFAHGNTQQLGGTFDRMSAT